MILKAKSILIVLSIVLMGLNLMAGQSVTFLHNGNSITDTIIDMSSRTGHVEFRNNMKIHKSQVWMINFMDGNWDFPNERQKLSGSTDTIFLRNGQILNVKIVDFSSRRKIFQFLKGGRVHESKVSRIYFCCTQLPRAYGQKQSTPASTPGSRSSATFWLNGKMVETPISYLNSSKTGFTDGFQMNTKDIWMINFENNQWDFAAERARLNKRMDTVFLTNGQVFYNRVVDFNANTMTFKFQSGNPIHESQIKRIYFCCTVLPQAFGSQSRSKYFKRKLQR